MRSIFLTTVYPIYTMSALGTRQTEDPTSTSSVFVSDSEQSLRRFLCRFDFIADVLNNKKHSGSNCNLYKSAGAQVKDMSLAQAQHIACKCRDFGREQSVKNQNVHRARADAGDRFRDKRRPMSHNIRTKLINQNKGADASDNKNSYVFIASGCQIHRPFVNEHKPA